MSRVLLLTGLLLRHLVMPGSLKETEEILRFIATSISPLTYVNIMDQYRPCGTASQHRELNRSVSAEEYLEALHLAEQAGLTRVNQVGYQITSKKIGYCMIPA